MAAARAAPTLDVDGDAPLAQPVAGADDLGVDDLPELEGRRLPHGSVL